MRQIAENAGQDGAVVAGKLLHQKNKNYGYDAKEPKYVDMINPANIDPTKDVRTA